MGHSPSPAPTHRAADSRPAPVPRPRRRLRPRLSRKPQGRSHRLSGCDVNTTRRRAHVPFRDTYIYGGVGGLPPSPPAMPPAPERTQSSRMQQDIAYLHTSRRLVARQPDVVAQFLALDAATDETLRLPAADPCGFSELVHTQPIRAATLTAQAALRAARAASRSAVETTLQAPPAPPEFNARDVDAHVSLLTERAADCARDRAFVLARASSSSSSASPCSSSPDADTAAGALAQTASGCASAREAPRSSRASSVLSSCAALEWLVRAESAWDHDVALGSTAPTAALPACHLPRVLPLPLEDIVVQCRAHAAAPADAKRAFDSEDYSNYTTALPSKRSCTETTHGPEAEFVRVITHKLARYCSYCTADSSEQDRCDKIRMQEIAYRLGKTDYHHDTQDVYVSEIRYITSEPAVTMDGALESLDPFEGDFPGFYL